jgi:hypothetical protein
MLRMLQSAFQPVTDLFLPFPFPYHHIVFIYLWTMGNVPEHKKLNVLHSATLPQICIMYLLSLSLSRRSALTKY